jgi:hypothetical protein
LNAGRSAVACYFMKFVLFRTGELRIWYDHDFFFGRDVSVEPVSPHEQEAADHLAPQAYYFIKDLLHAHYHHDPHSDQILPLTRLNTGGTLAAVTDDEVAWRYATLRGLARVIVEFRQGRSLAGHRQALGIAAYAQAFQAVLARVARGRAVSDAVHEHKQIILYDFTNLAQSIEATDAAAQSAISARLQLFAILIGIVLSGLALWAGAVQIQPILCTALTAPDGCPKIQPGPIVSGINTIVANPMAFLIALITLGLVLFVWWFQGTGAIPLAERTIRWLRRLSEAVGVQISRWARGSDQLGWVTSLAFLAGLIYLAATVAIRLAPKIPVPPIKAANEDSRAPWGQVYSLVGQRADQSGLLTRSVIAPALRSLLRDDYPALLRLIGSQPILSREGRLVTVHSASGGSGADGAYLILDPQEQRLEAGLRRDGLLTVHRMPGPALSRPASVRSFLGSAQRSDSGPVPVETSNCASSPGGPSGRTLHLSGALRASDFCEYHLELAEGQSVTFDRTKARGLEVLIVDEGETHPIRAAFKADRSGKQTVRVTWAGWNPKGAQALRPRPFYVRLDIH